MKKTATTHHIGGQHLEYLVEVDDVLAWKIVLSPDQRVCRLYQFDEERGLVLVDTAPFVAELLENIEAGGYDPLEGDNPRDL
jgi:hypothetical protein